ncbi:hypothetical protein GCM10018773_37030 [Streptomyces candidus]|nr:hypothetical protein GCM10018773_37030 [Streptomyces candidus]
MRRAPGVTKETEAVPAMWAILLGEGLGQRCPRVLLCFPGDLKGWERTGQESRKRGRSDPRARGSSAYNRPRATSSTKQCRKRPRASGRSQGDPLPQGPRRNRRYGRANRASTAYDEYDDRYDACESYDSYDDSYDDDHEHPSR